jgi:hypothetical protein
MKLALTKRYRCRNSLVTGLVLLLALCVSAAQAKEKPSALDSSVQWKDPTSVRLEVDFPGNGYHASWQLFRCSCGDLLIRSELNEPGEVAQGDILLVSNRAVLSAGYDENAEELISYDAPALMMQLALRLLERSEPKGPAAVTRKQKAEVSDDINYINLDTGTAAGGFPAPWSVKGSLSADGDTRRKFDLKFIFNTGGLAGGDEQQGEMRLSGVAEFAASKFPVSSDMSLQGWLLTWRDTKDPASQASGGVKTLGELRDLLKATPETPSGSE